MNLVPWRRRPSNGGRLPTVWDETWPFPTFGRLFGERGATLPAVDVIDGENEVVVKAEIPGVDKDDLKLELGDGYLTISGERREEKEDRREGYFHRELTYGSFSRTVALPAEVVADKAEAEYKNGVLRVTLPKTEEARKRSRRIKIK